MTEYLIQEESLTAIADAIREKTGSTAALSLDAMPNEIVSIDTSSDNTSDNVSPNAYWEIIGQDLVPDGHGCVTATASTSNTDNTTSGTRCDIYGVVYAVVNTGDNIGLGKINLVACVLDYGGVHDGWAFSSSEGVCFTTGVLEVTTEDNVNYTYRYFIDPNGSFDPSWTVDLYGMPSLGYGWG